MKARSHKKIWDDINQRQAAGFEKLCEIARSCDENALFRFFYENHLTINEKPHHELFFFDTATAVKKMAQEGNDKAVNMLIKTFKANPIEAAEGYAIARNVEKVEEFLRQYNAMNVVVRGYANAGDAEKVSNMLERGASITDAVYGAARSGHHDLVDHLLKRSGNKLNAMAMAITGYAHSGHIELTESMILHSTNIQQQVHDTSRHRLTKLSKPHYTLKDACDHALAGYAGNGYLLEPEKMLKLLSLTKNDVVRKHFSDLMKKNKSHLIDETTMSLQQLFNKAADIRAAMTDAPDLTYVDALAAWAPQAKAKPEPLLEAVKAEAAKPEMEKIKP